MTRWEWERRLRDASHLDAGLKYVGLMLATFGNANGGDIYPSTATLADACALNAKTVRKHREQLAAAGWIECERAGGGRGLSNKYRLTVPTESVPPVGSLSDGLRGALESETIPNNGSVSSPETLPNGAAKPSQTTPVNPPTGWEGTSTDQITGPEGVAAGPSADVASAHGLEQIEPVPIRHLADARESDDLELEVI